MVDSEHLAQSMKRGMRRLASGVSVISTRDTEGCTYAMTVSSVTSISDAPPSLLVCIHTGTRISPVLVKGKHFAINVLSCEHQDVSITCSTGDQSEERFEVGDWSNQPKEQPYLKDAEAIFFCEIDDIHAYGTHNIVVAKIIKVDTPRSNIAPLVYVDGGYCALSKGD